MYFDHLLDQELHWAASGQAAAALSQHGNTIDRHMWGGGDARKFADEKFTSVASWILKTLKARVLYRRET